MPHFINKPNNRKLKLVVQIPAYNEEKHIGLVIKEIPRKIPGISEVIVLVCDDGSTDNTIEAAKNAGADYIIKNKKNLGLGKNFKNAILTALKLKADIIVNIDADGQFNTQDIPKLIKPIQEQEADMVTVSRFINSHTTENIPFLKKWGNKRFTNLVSKITGQKFTDTQCGFRAYSREAALRMNLHGTFTYTQEVFIDLVEKGMRIKEIPSRVIYKKERKSVISGNLRRYGFKSLGIIAKTTRDTQPLSFFGFPAILILFLGAVGGIFSFSYWLFNGTTNPVKTLLSVSIFLAIFGLSLSIFALLADMLKRINMTQEEVLYRLKKIEIEKGDRRIG